MEATHLISLIETLDDNVDDLKEALTPFLKAESASTLPLLEKAQLYVLVTYAIESLLFCRLLQFDCQLLNTNNDSLLTIEWRQCQRASYFS